MALDLKFAADAHAAKNRVQNGSCGDFGPVTQRAS